jgi:uncharacterized protein
MATRSIYRGFSTQKSLETRGRSFSTSDVETVKADLLNHIYTIRGERVMQPNFGTRIPLMAFEPLDPTSIKIIEDDLREVFNYDPRVKLIDLVVLALPDNNAIVAVIDIQYLELGTFDTLKLEFPTGS